MADLNMWDRQLSDRQMVDRQTPAMGRVAVATVREGIVRLPGGRIFLARPTADGGSTVFHPVVAGVAISLLGSPVNRRTLEEERLVDLLDPAHCDVRFLS